MLQNHLAKMYVDHIQSEDVSNLYFIPIYGVYRFVYYHFEPFCFHFVVHSYVLCCLHCSICDSVVVYHTTFFCNHIYYVRKKSWYDLSVGLRLVSLSDHSRL